MRDSETGNPICAVETFSHCPVRCILMRFNLREGRLHRLLLLPHAFPPLSQFISAGCNGCLLLLDSDTKLILLTCSVCQ